MDAIPELALEPIPVKQGHKELEVRIFAVMGRSCKQKEMARQA